MMMKSVTMDPVSPSGATRDETRLEPRSWQWRRDAAGWGAESAGKKPRGRFAVEQSKLVAPPATRNWAYRRWKSELTPELTVESDASEGEAAGLVGSVERSD